MKQQESIEKYDYDVAVLGAGPAGMMAAGRAAQLGLRVVLVEKNAVPARKLLLTGNGRCNLTNLEFNLSELVKKYHNGDFLFHIFSIFGPKEAIRFFEDLGVKTKVEKGKRVFPVSNEAHQILAALKRYVAENKVDILFGSEVVKVVRSDNRIEKLILKNREIVAKKYILAMGGKSYPLTGSDGFGYELAKKLGHTIEAPLPALSSIIVKEQWVKKLQGISFKDVKLTVLRDGKKQLREEGGLVFTHFGISGPAVLNISADVGDLLKKGETKIAIDLMPSLNVEEFREKLNGVFEECPKKKIKNILSDFVTARLAENLPGIMGIDKDRLANTLSKRERGVIVSAFKRFELTVESIFGFNEAKTTRGGISLAEIDRNTMRSKIIDNLFFAGEIINIDGKTGGFNLQLCWSTGYVAAESCRENKALR